MNKPTHFLILKIAGFIGIVTGIIGFVLVIDGFGNFESNSFMIGSILGSFGTFVGVVCLVLGFRPEIARISINTNKYILNQNKDELSSLASESADITAEAVEKTAAAASRGMSAGKIYCKHCGDKIDEDSKFCKSCGGKQ